MALPKITDRDYWTGGQVDRGYADLDAGSKQIANKSLQEASLSPEERAANLQAQAMPAKSLLASPDSLGSRDLRLGMGGNEAFNRAIADRAAKVFSTDINHLKAQNTQEAYGEQGDSLDSSFHQASTQNAIQLGAFQKHYEYDMNRRQIRQQAINTVLGYGAQIGGYVLGKIPSGLRGGEADSDNGPSITKDMAGGQGHLKARMEKGG